MIIKGYRIKWRYEDYVFHTLKGTKESRPMIKCIISTDEAEEKVISEGIAVCSPMDHYSKEVGRRISFEKAVGEMTIPQSERGEKILLEQEYTFPKEIRAAFWEGFRTMTKNPKW